MTWQQEAEDLQDEQMREGVSISKLEEPKGAVAIRMGKDIGACS